MVRQTWGQGTMHFQVPTNIDIANFLAPLVQALPLCYTSFTLNLWRNADASVDWLSCIKFWTSMWRCWWISWIWFCVIDLLEDLLLNKDLKYLVVLQLRFRSPLLQELLLSGIHYQTLSPRRLRYHPSEASCLLHRARRSAHSIAEISARRSAIINLLSRSRSRSTCTAHALTSVHVHPYYFSITRICQSIKRTP